MNPLGEIERSLGGLAGLAAGRPEAAASFRCDAAGVAMAVAAYFAAVLVAVAIQSATGGLPGVLQFWLGLLAQALTLLALRWTLSRLLQVLGSPVAADRMFVPAVYALAYSLLVGVLLAAVTPGLALLSVLAVSALIFKAAQALAGLSVLPAAALALGCCIVLVVVPGALYMLLSLLPPTA